MPECFSDCFFNCLYKLIAHCQDQISLMFHLQFTYMVYIYGFHIFIFNVQCVMAVKKLMPFSLILAIVKTDIEAFSVLPKKI